MVCYSSILVSSRTPIIVESERLLLAFVITTIEASLELSISFYWHLVVIFMHVLAGKT